MPTNTKEYMREYQRARRARIKNSCKENVKEIVKDVKVLHPPRAPVKVEKSVSTPVGFTLKDKEASNDIDSKTIDFSYLTNNSSFQRAIMEFIRKYVPGLEDLKVRGTKEVMKQSFDQNANNYRNVMKELKEVLLKRNER